MPPLGLDGLDPAFSRVVEAAGRGWHVLDNGQQLADRGIEPVGTILCVHGNPTWSYLWRKLVSGATDAAMNAGTDAAMDAAAPGSAGAWRVIAVDQLDMGFSERTAQRRTLAQRVRDLGDLTDALALDGPVVTLGHDWGGVVSLGWAVDHPDLLAGVMLLNTAIHQPEQYPIPAPLRLALQKSVLGAATVTTPAFLETTLAIAHPRLPRVVADGYRAPYRTADRRGGIGGFVADIPVGVDKSGVAHESIAELDRIAEGIRSIGVPALMLWGPRDPIFSDRYLDDLAERMPHADVHRFEGAGHLVAEDADYVHPVLSWLADLRAAEPATDGSPADDASTPAPAPDGRAAAASAPDYRPLWRHLDALRDSDDLALVEMVPPTGDAPRLVSWKLLSRRVRELAAGLTLLGVQKGDRVSLLVPPGADLTAVLYACVRIGAIVVVADAGLGLRGLTRAVRGARPDHLIGALPGLSAARALGWPGKRISTTRLPEVTRRLLGVHCALADVIALGRGVDGAGEELPEEPAATDTAAVLFTSGSTGPAKGVVYTHGQLAAVTAALSDQYGVGVGTGLVAGFAPFALLGPALGARSATPDMNVTSPKTLTAASVAAAVAAVDATVVFLSPAAIANVVATAGELTADDRRGLAGVQTFLSAGAPVSESLLTSAAELMPNASAHTPYGMTEGLLMADISLDGIRDALGSLRSLRSVGEGAAAGGVCVGRPTATTRIRISPLDDDGRSTATPVDVAGVTGEIVVSAPHVEDHYDRLWITDRASRRGTDATERWHRTGDVGHLDDSGRLWVEGRLPHVITTADGVVTPVAPEQRIERVAGVGRAAVVGVGPRGVQQVVAIVETTAGTRRPGLAAPSLAAAVRASIALPIAAVLVVPRLPTDVRHNSKIDRSRLSAWAGGVLSGERMVAP
ncbi:alpha/beta fold hydrolase [Marisediminicola senii]|uniref:alpha/beta fold hydrolase n=1 Tax=Marisediminicola senii TaxID=2711233 RepID=UPI0013EA2960|nr:alpha/beta fold hydrolase [Marisediminicola senii]